jgi:hypothetical protein
MAIMTEAGAATELPAPQITERAGYDLPGPPMLVLGIARLLGGTFLMVWINAVTAAIGVGRAAAPTRIVGLLLALTAILVRLGFKVEGPLRVRAPGRAVTAGRVTASWGIRQVNQHLLESRHRRWRGVRWWYAGAS